MKNILFALSILFVVPIYLMAQQSVGYTYDNAGNLESRYTIILPLKSVGAENSEQSEKYSDKLGETQYSIFPNPTQGVLNLTITNLNENQLIDIMVYDINGNILLQEKCIKNSTTIDLSNFVSGDYIFRLTEGENARIWKIIKQ